MGKHVQIDKYELVNYVDYLQELAFHTGDRDVSHGVIIEYDNKRVYGTMWREDRFITFSRDDKATIAEICFAVGIPFSYC